MHIAEYKELFNGHLECVRMEHPSMSVKPRMIYAGFGVLIASSVSTQAYVYAPLLTVYGACLHVHSLSMCSKAKTAPKAQLHLGNTAIVGIPTR